MVHSARLGKFTIAGIALAVLAAAVFPMICRDEYIIHLGVLVLWYLVLASTLHLIIGCAGLFSLAHASFVGIGAYTCAWLCLRLGVTKWLAVLAGGLVCCVVSVCISLPSLRLKGPYLAITTIGFQEIMVTLFLNWVAFTGGPAGLSGIPRLWPGKDWLRGSYYMMLVMACIVVWCFSRLESSDLGLILRAMRGDDIASRALGVNIGLLRVTVFAIAYLVVGISGGMYALYMGTIDPFAFRIDLSTTILAMVLVGGSTSLPGSLAGAVMLSIIPELFRGRVGPGLRMVLFGLVIISCLRYMPDGLAGLIRKKCRKHRGTHAPEGRAETCENRS